MPFTIAKATPDDAAAIAKVLLSGGTETLMYSSRSFTGFATRLQLGTIDPAILEVDMTEKIAVNIKKPNQTWIIARDEEMGEIVSYAQWELPAAHDEVVSEPDPNVSDEH
ncbi:hypothetical protein CLAFUW4_00283 [Fulvia fulva]|uniref:Uncharacterized protein n=1 Tax=Passalora fulva TaxID=5499 RepID=A0A9Q8P2D5_PASFU|nr:uncharacterized protein CLAFUR5_00284 [Fulvia fulva]KAK4634716.1 hypothetical protein CLAFUR4_00283 [Fulvia fulva]KAK4637282.1 hypothetical protein CLAFUR0_00284 [Fulvia fulva]UJO10905.1 hypothetical protein CLAFUR5_00284 [Fulvia fulva]WPV10378.1 hypothetical protein CLAFUW4_00283 [Fulvia fulva]WPV24487.1 hypothetical protein CLAFUW7_00287 [Fulvia fulva]